MRSDERKAIRNNAVLSEIKTISAKLLTMKDDPKQAKEYSVKVMSKYDQAASKGIIPRGRADRRKSRIANFIASLEPATKKKKSASAKKKAQEKQA